ncbi:MAG: hypothetical protein IRZ03_16460 [Acidobacterium ailaaui]|nr:hypothetical protein [Pseudacidobacterium ailaaui]
MADDAQVTPVDSEEVIARYLNRKRSADAKDRDKTDAETASQVSGSAEETPAGGDDRRKPPLRVIEGGLRAAENVRAPSLSDLPTPGGIALLLLLIGLILLAILPTSSGESRLQLLWQAILGNLSLVPAGSSASSGSSQAAGGGWGPPNLNLPPWVP